MAFSISAPLLEALVLSVCSKEDAYGYKITQQIRQALDVSESTLYPVLRRLQKDDMLDVYDRQYNGRNRRYYRITPSGTNRLTEYRHQWEEHKAGIDYVLNGGEEIEKS